MCYGCIIIGENIVLSIIDGVWYKKKKKIKSIYWKVNLI